MARYVVLKFDDNEVAERFVSDNEHVVALVPAPTLFCESEPETHRGIKKDGFFRGKKYGWWVCTRCGKPKRAWGSKYNAVISAGINLLEASTHATRVEPEPPRGWDQHTMEGNV